MPATTAAGSPRDTTTSATVGYPFHRNTCTHQSLQNKRTPNSTGSPTGDSIPFSYAQIVAPTDPLPLASMATPLLDGDGQTGPGQRRWAVATRWNGLDTDPRDNAQITIAQQ